MKFGYLGATLLMATVIAVTTAGCAEDKSAASVSQANESQSEISTVSEIEMLPQVGDIRLLDAVPLRNASFTEQPKEYKVGDDFLGLIISDLQYQQKYNGTKWVDESISVSLQGTLTLNVDTVFQGGELISISVQEFSYSAIPAIANTTASKAVSCSFDSEDVKSEVAGLAQTERNIPTDLMESQERTQCPFTLSVNQFTIQWTKNTEAVIHAQIETVSSWDVACDEAITLERIQQGDIAWQALVTREKGSIFATSLDESAATQNVQVGDKFLDTEITRIENIEYYYDGEWYTGRTTALFEGNLELQGDLVADMGLRFVPNESSQSKIPSFIEHPSKEYRTTLIDLDESTTDYLLEKYQDDLFETDGDKPRTDYFTIKDVSITFVAYGRVYHTGEGGIDNLSAKVLEIVGSDGEVICIVNKSDRNKVAA